MPKKKQGITNVIIFEEPVTIKNRLTPQDPQGASRGGQRSLCLNLANCRNAQTNYPLTSQQSVPFPPSAFFSPSSSRFASPEMDPANAFDLLQSRRSVSPRESVHRRSTPPYPFSLFHSRLFFSLRGLFDPGEVPRWSPIQNTPPSIDYPRSTGATIAIVF